MHHFVFLGVLLLAATACAQPNGGYTVDERFGFFDRELKRDELSLVRSDELYQYFTLEHPFTFVDPNRRVFVASPGVEVNGASIPEFFREYIGEPWDWAKGYVPASVVHDVYCTGEHRYQYTCWEVHRMFYDACRANGTNELLARRMYAAILLGGPKWEQHQEEVTEEILVVQPDGTQKKKTATRLVVSRVEPAVPLGKRLSREQFNDRVEEIVALLAEAEEGTKSKSAGGRMPRTVIEIGVAE